MNVENVAAMTAQQAQDTANIRDMKYQEEIELMRRMHCVVNGDIDKVEDTFKFVGAIFRAQM